MLLNNLGIVIQHNSSAPKVVRLAVKLVPVLINRNPQVRAVYITPYRSGFSDKTAILRGDKALKK